MAGDKFDQLYNALKADGAVSGTREHFRQFVYAPGKQGYHNRKQLYDALHADGAVSSSSYEEFAQRLGLHAVNPKPQQQKPVQPVKKLTMKQRAQEVAAQYRKPRQQKAQQPRTATTSGTDYMQNWRLMHMRNDQMNPMQQAQASNARARMQRAQEQSARQEQQRATPISRSRITPTAKNFNETMQQLSTPEAKQARAKQQREDDARTLAQYEVEGNKFVRNDGQTEGILGNDLLELVDSSMNEAQELTRQQYQQNLDKMGGIYAPQSVKEQAFRDAQTQEQVNRQNVLMNNLSSKINEIYSQKGMQRHIAESADKLNMSVEEYVDKYVTPEIMNYAQKALTMRNQEEIMPHGALDYIAKNLSNSIIGMVVAPSVMSRDTRQRLQEGIAIADGDAEIQKVAGHKDETYRSGIGTRFASTAVNMAADSGPLAVIGAGASAAVNTGTRVLTNGLVKAGVMKAAQKLTAQQMAFKVANMTTAQKIMSGLGTKTATGALNLAGYSGVTAALNQASTGDDTSLQAIGEAGLKGAEHGAVTGAMFGVSGAIMSPWVSKFGITGMEKSTGERLLHGAQKFGATAAGLGVEAGTMMVADNVTGDKDISFGTWLEDVVMVGAFKAGEPSNFVKMGNILHHLTHNSGGNFVIGKNANGSPIAVDIRLTPDEKNELISSASGKNLMDAFVKVDRESKTAPRDPKYKTAYTDFMSDPDVSQSTKEKVNAAMGLFNTTRGKSYRSVNDVKNKQILEYTKNGTLLTRTSYKNADERRAILYKQKLYRDNDDMMSLMGYARMKDMQFIDDDGTVTNLAFRFLKENGYDENKDITDPNNARLINDLRNQKSALYLDWTKYADKNGLLGNLRSESRGITNNFMASIKELLGKEGSIVIDIDKIMRKDPMKRTDEENRIFYHVKKALEDELFPSWRPHADQSASQGKTVAEEHSLGTDNPDSGVVVDELRNLRNAEQALDAAMDSNDVFKQTFEKLHQQGLTPAQIYDALIQNGLMQEELTPLAQYINANARVQGMQQATADSIEENVKSFISDWSYHGTLNGQPMNGEQALYVQDSSGRTLLVGSGDVAFDQNTGRAKEGSGDMLVCLDPNTKEMVYVKADEVTLLQNQPIDQFAAEYRQRLQMKNSEPYNQAAQEQAMLDAAKPQPKEQEAPQDNTTKSEDSTTKEGDLTKVDTTSSKDNTTNEDLAPQEQPQQTRKFADGTDVPMSTDSKGRPTPDYASMTPEQSAEILTEDFGENAEKVVDGQIKKAENALKDAEKMKVDYTAEPNDIMEQEALKTKTVEAAKQQLEHVQNIKKTMTAQKVAETVGKTEQTEGAHEAGSVAAKKFVNAPRLVGNKRTRMLPDGETKIKGHYEIVPAESLTPSHDVNNDYKKSEGFPTDAEGRTVNDRDYEHDKAAQQNTDQIARKYNGMAIEQVPVVSDEGIVYDGNGRTMAGQKAAKEGTDGEYINDLLENAENFGFTREQIEQSGIEHPRLVLVTDERLPYDAATFAKFNRNEKKTQSNTEQAVAKAKTLTSDEVGAIVAEIEGNGSLDAFFNNSKAINDLVKTLVDKGIIGQNEVAQMMDSPERLSAQGREYVKNLLLGSIFKPETIRMLGIDSTVKNKAINAIRSVMDNMKLGDYSLRDEIDQAIQLLYEARQGGNKVDTLLRTPSMFVEDAAKRYPSISQMMALALEGKVSDFRDLLDEYNRIAVARNTGEGSIFEAAPTKEELVKEFLDFKKWQDYGTGHSENEGGNDVSGVEEPQQEASGGNEPAEAERPRVEEADDLENKELESRIEVTDEETETPSKNGPIMKQKILIDGDKEVIKVDEPNEKGEYTGSYYEYDGKKFGDLNGVLERIDDKTETSSEEMPKGTIYDRKKALLEEIEKGGIKKKDDAFQLLYKAEDLLDDYLGIPHDEWKPEPSRSNTIAGILSMARNALDRIKNEPVEPATEKQLSYLERLTSDDPTTRKLLEGVKLNKKQATWLIGNIKGLDDNLMRLHPDDIAETEKFIHDGIEYMKKLNGETSKEGGLPLLPKEEKPDPTFDPIAAAAQEFKKEHPLTEDEGTHFREDRGLQYSKTDTKDVKKGRIIPEDVDKNVSSQIEKKFDSAIEDIVEYAEDRDKSRLVDDADYAVEEFSNLGRSVIEYYKNDYERKVEKLSGQHTGGHLGGTNDGKGNRGSYLLQYYKTILAVADRELAYRDARAKNLRETWGLQPGGTFTLGDVERIFKETNRDKEKAKLFQRVLDINKRLGVNIKVSAESPKKRSGEADIYRNIDLYIDGLTKTKAPDYAAPTIMLHEMIHEVTMGAINLVKKGKAEGMLTPKQIEGVKTILEIYDKVKDDKERFKEEPYGLSDAYELTAQMADSRQRKAMDLSIWDRVMNAAHEFARRGDRSILQRVKDAIKKLFEVSDKDKMDKVINDIMDDFNETIDNISMNEIEQDGFSYKVTDKDELDRLNKEKTFRMYSGMQEVDGKLYSPMAAIIDGKRTDATEIGAWMGADERPDLVKNGKFTLVKTDKNKGVGEGDVPAAYNPYMHTSTSMMNDQFTGAYARGNIKVVEWEIPESEKTSGYHAEGAKDVVGLVPWHSGSVNSLLPKDRQRQVMLSRWRKAVRVVPDSEVAESIAEQLKGTGLAIPWNVVTPNQVRELAKLGVPITTVESGRQAPETKEKFLQQMAELEQEFPQAKFVNVKMTKDAFKEWGKDGGTKFRTDHGGGNYPTSSVESHIEKVAQKTGAKVNMVSSVDEITNKAAKAAIEDGRKITGWYDEKTGEVHLYMPNIHDRYTAEKTIWHEVVGHKGMRELFGDERFDKFLREVWYDLDKPENAALKKLVDEERKFNPLNIYDAIEEGIARLAEDGKGEPGFWNGIKNKVSDFLHEIGYRVAPNTKDVKYLLWLSKNLQKNPNDPYWKLRAEAVKYRLDHERMPAVVAHDGMFYGNDGKVRSMDNLTKAEWNEATDGEIHFRTTPSAGTALDRYHRSLDEHGYMLTESYMDNMLSLKKLMNAIVPDKKIEDIASSENPYMLQNTMQGAMSDAAQMFERNVMKPLDKAMADVLDAFDGKKDDEKIRNFNLYMITKHGLERNREFFVRDFLRNMRMDEQKKQDADFLENSYYSDKEYLDNELKAGNIDLKEYYRQLDESIRNHFDADFEAGEHDYSGMHAIQEVTKSSDPYNDAEAIQSVMDSEAKMESIKKGAVKDYWDKVKAATQYSIDSDYKNGIISKELHGHVSNMFNWYVPLRKYDEATAEDTYGYITEQGDPKSYIGSTIMRARGHKYLSETNVLAQIGAMGNRAIKNGGMNAIRQAFARFARNNSGNNLITETSVWYEKDPVVNIVYERYPDIPEDATADEINQIVSDFNKDMKMKESQGMAYKVYRRDKIGYKFQRAENKSQHIVDVKIAGRTHTFIINGNPRAAQALNGLLENSGAKGIMKPLSSISRMMAQLCTSYNPEFVMRNIMRDAEFASSNVTSKEGARYGALWAKYYAQLGLYKGASNISFKDLSGTTGLGLFAKYRNGTLDTSDKVQRYFKEFMENGGETGWVQIKNMQDWTKEYKKDVKSERSKIDKGGAVLRDFFFGNLANINEVVENIARFATYCASRDSNRSIIRSVYDAKEVSTNFNRHGSGDAIKSFKNGEMTGGKAAARWAYGFTASYLRHCSMFFNAGIQSTNLLVKNLKNHPVGTSINMLAIPFALGALAALGNNVLIASEDEKDRKGVKDPYGELPDYVRRNNLCIYKGGGQFVTIPLAIELRAFFGLGDLAAGLTFSTNVSGQKNPALDAVGCMSQLVPVMDYLGNSSAGKEPLNETIKAISPSALSPFVEWELNTDWKGAPIERRGDWNENSPAWQRAYKGVPDGYMAVNKWVNAQTNDVAKGNEDMLGNSFLDMVTNPSMLNHYIGGIGGGAATFTERAIGVIKHGKDTETKDIPFLRSLLYTPSEQSSLQRTKSKWYNYKDEMEKTMANVDRLKSKNVPLDKRITNIGEYYHFQNSKEAAKVRVIELAEKQMKRWKKLRDKSSDTESINFANQNIDRIMMDAVDELDRLE